MSELANLPAEVPEGVNEQLGEKIDSQFDSALLARIHEKDERLALSVQQALALADTETATQIINTLDRVMSYVDKLDGLLDNRSVAKDDNGGNSFDAALAQIKSTSDVNRHIIPEVKERLLVHTRTALEVFVLMTGEENAKAILLEKFNQVAVGAVVLSAILSPAREEFYAVYLNDLPLLNLETHDGGTIIDIETLKSIRQIYEQNYKSRPGVLKELLEGFEEFRQKPESELFVARMGDDVMGFCGYEFRGPDYIYFGKFNIAPEFAGRKLGVQMLEETLDEYATTHIIEADCNRDSEIAMKYLDMGFIAAAGYQFHEDNSWKIFRNETMNNLFPSKKASLEVLGGFLADFQPNETVSIELSGKSVQLTSIIDDEFHESGLNLFKSRKGFARVITRIFKLPIDNDDRKIVVIASEEISQDQLEKYKSTFERSQVV
ncbi:MAG: GNAT family N-acetyltransferase [Candidatus Taylorbacteria bacterium]|nr:GNAT family N-acetyltransferase [Candidatus Taylorbacteria bacterium]